MCEEIKNNNLSVILVQIDEAHSSAWPMALENQPEPQKTFNERVERANYFINEYKPPYPVYIDGWNNEFGELFRAWPDQFHCIDRNFKVIAKSEYGMYNTENEKEAMIIEDYTDTLRKLIDGQ